MEHANFSRIAAVANVKEHPFQPGQAASGQSRSAQTEMAIRELAKLQAQAARLAEIIEAADGFAGEDLSANRPCSDASIRAILQARLERNSCFPGELFSDPAWDMLLDLYAAELGQFRVSVTSLCIASNAPTSTALRWISTLERENLIERRPDPLDGRRFFMSLTPEAIKMFERYFSVVGNRAII